LGLELVALRFQHGMGLDPCVKCLYERVAVAGLFCAGVIGSMYPRAIVVPFLGYLISAASVDW
jgi:disulfide bond formation protein DsbB